MLSEKGESALTFSIQLCANKIHFFFSFHVFGFSLGSGYALLLYPSPVISKLWPFAFYLTHGALLPILTKHGDKALFLPLTPTVGQNSSH